MNVNVLKVSGKILKIVPKIWGLLKFLRQRKEEKLLFKYRLEWPEGNLQQPSMNFSYYNDIIQFIKAEHPGCTLSFIGDYIIVKNQGEVIFNYLVKKF